MKGKWVKQKSSAIVYIFPHPSGQRNNPNQWEDFCHIKIILHVPFRDISQLKDEVITWAEAYEHLLPIIQADGEDLLGPIIDNYLDSNDEDESMSNDEEDIIQVDWMRLAEMGPRTNINITSDLGNRDIDINYNWNEGQLRYPDLDVNTFIQHQNPIDEIDNDIISEESLNEIQKHIYNRIITHYTAILAGRDINPLSLMVMGTADTGKS